MASSPCDLALLERWLTGWSRSRGLPLPRHAGGGLVVDVGAPDQLRRQVFPDAGAALSGCAAGIHDPFIHLKAAVDTGTLRRALPASWRIEEPRYLMQCDGPMRSGRTVPAGYGIHLTVEHGAYRICCTDATGAVAASGSIVLHAGTAVFDRIETAASHRRQGLASALMLALDQLACQAGASERLLVATEAGAPLYASLGWRHLAPWSTAVLG
jgi:GNAT superfamily N-acetyltransferase